MRRLDESLGRLAERGERVGADVLLERVEQRLELGSDPVVVALDPRRTDMQTQQETPSPARTRGPLIAAAAFVVAVAIAVGAVIVTQAGERESLVAGEPIGPLEAYVAAVQANDATDATAVLSRDLVEGFTPYLIGLDTSTVEFYDCVINESQRVTCRTKMGPAWFYSRIVGENLESTFSATILDGKLEGLSWPEPGRAGVAELEFQAWAEANYPERWDEMFTEVSLAQHIKFTAESGRARSELLEEFLASR